MATDKYPPFTLKSVGYPADLSVEYPENLSQGLVLIKWWLLAVTHFIIVGLLGGGLGYRSSGLVTVLALFGAIANLFTGNYPKDIYKFVIGCNRWAYRVAAYASLMTDKYPPFRLEE